MNKFVSISKSLLLMGKQKYKKSMSIMFIFEVNIECYAIVISRKFLKVWLDQSIDLTRMGKSKAEVLGRD